MRVLENKQMQEMIEEEELSEDEVKKQMENNKYYRFMREKNKKNQLLSFEKR